MKYFIRIDGNNLRVLVKDFTLCSIYRSNQPLWKIHGIASINFDCFTIDESNQVKISCKIMRFWGCFLKLLWGWGCLFYSELAPSDPWCNMPQTLLGWKKYEEGMSHEQSSSHGCCTTIFLGPFSSTKPKRSTNILNECSQDYFAREEGMVWRCYC